MGIIAGNLQQLGVGVEYEVTATVEFNSKYSSHQYNPRSVVSISPDNELKQRRFLEAILTEKQTSTLLDVYPNIVNDVIKSEDNIDLNKLKGIGETTWANIKSKILSNYVLSDILVLLSPLGVSMVKIKMLLDYEPNPHLLKKKILDNPYILTAVHGLGFKSVDTIALKLSPELRISEKRLRAFIEYYFNELGSETGNTWDSLNDLENAVRDNMNECIDIYGEFIEKEKNKNKLLCIDVKNNHVGLVKHYQMEKEVLYHIRRLQRSVSHIDISDNDILSGIESAEKKLGYKLSEDQISVVNKSIKDNVIIFSGKSGTGKSSLSNAFLEIHKNYSIACCALSAKAAQRIIELTGRSASTIHRLLGFPIEERCELSYDVVFVDECSMINLDVFLSLLRAVRSGSKLIMCGDDQQLPPIGSGNVFNDLLSMKGEVKSNVLTKVHRQAENSGILIDSNIIRDGISPIELPELKIVHGENQDMVYMFRDSREELRDIAIKTYLNSIDEYGTDETVIITPRKKNCINSTYEINKIIQDILIPKGKEIVSMGRSFRVGTKVIQRANDYERNIVNGETGYVKEIIDDKRLVVEFKLNNDIKEVECTKSQLEDVDLAYAMTVHSIQGSQAKTVITIIDNTHFILLDTCLLYTALTRATKRCLLLAEPKAYRMCISNNNSKARQTWLKTFEGGVLNNKKGV